MRTKSDSFNCVDVVFDRKAGVVRQTEPTQEALAWAEETRELLRRRAAERATVPPPSDDPPPPPHPPAAP